MAPVPETLLGFIFYVALIIVVSFGAHSGVARIQKRLVARGHWPRRLNLVKRFFLPLQIALLSAVLLAAVDNVESLQPYASLLRIVGKISLILGVTLVLLRIIDVIFRMYEGHLVPTTADDLRQRRSRTRLQFLERMIDVFVVIIAISTALLSFEGFRKFGGSLLASAGLASVILGLAAQKSLSNLIAGFQIAFTQPIRLGDAVVVENEWGWIEEINLTYVVVKLWDLRRLILPITYFLEKPFQNWTRTSASIIGSVFLYVDYSVPLDPLRAELTRILMNSKRWDRQTNVLQVTDTSDRGITLRALMSAPDSPTAWDLRCEVREKLILYIQKNHPNCLPLQRVHFASPTSPSAAEAALFSKNRSGPSDDWADDVLDDSPMKTGRSVPSR